MTDTISEIHSNGEADIEVTKARPVRAAKPKTEKDTQEVMKEVLAFLWHKGGGTFDDLLPAADRDAQALRRAINKLEQHKRVTTILNEGVGEYKLRELAPNQRDQTFNDFMKDVTDEVADRTVFKEWKVALFHIRLTRPSLAGLPLGSDSRHLSFRRLDDIRDGKETAAVWLSTDYFRALWRAAAQRTKLDKEQKSVFWNDYASYDDFLLDPSCLMTDDKGKIKECLCIAPPSKSGGATGGSGFTFHEQIRVGTVIPTAISYPSSVFEDKDREILREILTLGGKLIGFSPAKHKLGWGRFEVVEDEMSP